MRRAALTKTVTELRRSGTPAEHSASGVVMTEEWYHQRDGIDVPAEWLEPQHC